MLTIESCKEQNYKTTQKQKNLTNQILTEKTKTVPTLKQIEIWQQKLDDIENHRIQGTIIRTKIKLIINQEKSSKYFYQQEKQKQLKKQIKLLTTDSNKILQTGLQILKECKKFYQNIYRTFQTCKKTQNQLLQNIP